jgi:hypothetical protein
MTNFLESYGRRIREVDSTLKEVSQDLIKDGYRVFTHKHGLVKFIKIFKDDKEVTLGFSEVPYSWYLSIDYIPSIHKGSGAVLKTFGYEEFPSKKTITSYMRETPYGNADKHIATLNYMNEILADETIHEPQQ